ncbi:MAG: hypothetical protein ACKPBV_08630 [Sphaerospermopsis kisseleviana]
MRRLLTFPVWLVLVGVVLAGATACNKSLAVGPETKADEEKAKMPRPFARLFVQDLEMCSLRCADLRVGEKDEFTVGSFATVEGFKKLDPAKQKFAPVAAAAEKPTQLIGYTEGRNDLEGGQFVNWITNRACVVGADG